VPCLQETLSSLARPLEPTTWHPVVRKRGRSQGYLRTTARSGQPVPLAECHAPGTQRPVDTESSVAWELRPSGQDGSTQPRCAQVTRGSPPYVPGFPRTQRKDTSPSQDRATSLQFLPAWPRAAIATGQARAALALPRLQGARSPLRPHSQVFHEWSDPLSTASTAPPRPGSRPLWGRLLAGAPELRIAFLLRVPSSAHSRSKWHDVPLMFQRTPNLEPTRWRRGRLSRGGHRSTSSPVQLNQPGTLATPWMGQLPSPDYMSQKVGEDAKGHSVRSRAGFPAFWAPNPNTACKHTH
jgi:hypothetical protein